MPPVHAVLFDLDGVLIDSYHVWFHLLNHTTSFFGFPPITPEAYHGTWGQGVEADIAAFMPGTPLAAVQAFFADHYAEHVAHVKLEPGALETLRAVRDPGPGAASQAGRQPGGSGRSSRPRGVVTNTPGALARLVLAQVGLLPELEAVVGADEAGRSKPAPDGVYKLLERFAVGPEAAILVGDSVYDRDAATAAGVTFVGLRMDVEHRIETLDALPAWLQAWEDR